MNFRVGLVFTFILSSALQLTDGLVCPPADTIAPCTCFLRENYTEIGCEQPDVTQKSITTAFHEMRLVNDLVSTEWLILDRFALGNTNMYSLDLTPLFRTKVHTIYMYENHFLSSIPDPPENLFIHSIEVAQFSIWNSALRDRRIGGFLGFLVPSELVYFSIVGAKLQGGRISIDEFLPGFSTFTELQDVELYDNCIDRVGHGQFRKLRKLIRLDLDENDILEIGPDAFVLDELEEMENVTIRIGLSNGVLTDALLNNSQIGLSRMSRPVELDLRNNAFDFISEENFNEFLKARDTNTIDLGGNPLFCDARMRWLKDRKDELENRVLKAFCDNDPSETVFTTDLI